ncbi:hypothetical protein GQ457_09G027590 [Hibiscus cannabinus]
MELIMGSKSTPYSHHRLSPSGNVHGVITANPLNVEYALKTNFENYPNGERYISILNDFLGHGIFTSDGDLWKIQRKTTSYEFSTTSLRNFIMDSVRFEISTRLIPVLNQASETNQIPNKSTILISYNPHKSYLFTLLNHLHLLAMEMELIFSVQSLLLLSLIILFGYYYFSLHHKQNGVNHGFKIYPILGALPDFLRNRHRFLDWTNGILRRCPTNTAVFHRAVKVHGVFTANPLNVEYVLKTNFENYPKGEHFIWIFNDLFGQGIFNSDGDLWKVQRKAVSSEFSSKSIRNFTMDTVVLEILTRLIPVLNRASETNQELDLQEIFEQFAFDNICKLVFNVDPGCLGGNGIGSHFMRAFEEATMLSLGRFMYVFPFLGKISRIFNMGSERNLKKSIEIVHEFTDNIVQTRLQSKDETKDEDLLSRLIRNGDDSPRFLRDIIISFILAGRDTTPSALTWFFWLLSLNPNIERNILNELEMIRTRNEKTIGDTYTLGELRDMHYLHAAISESLRLYPPVPVDRRVCLNDDILPDGTFIGKGWFLTYHAYAMGRTEAIWGKNCDEYLPERWLDEDGNCKQENPFKFPIFHGGPRMCLGKYMAYIQMKSIVAAVLERFVLDVQGNGECPQHLLSLTLRMKGGLPVRVKKR